MKNCRMIMALTTCFMLILSLVPSFAEIISKACCRTSGVEDSLTCDCSNCGLTSIPKDIPSNIKTLILRNNSLETMEGRLFKEFTSLEHLDVSLNGISTFVQDAFVGLSKLKHLDTRQEATNPTLAEGLFTPLIQLQSLRLSRTFNKGEPFPGNWINSIHPSLKSLEMPVPPRYVFTPDFARLTNLESLIITGKDCRLMVVTNDTFRVFSNSHLKTLEVKICWLQDISPDSLSMFQALENLNFACNYHQNLKFIKIFEAAKKLPSNSLQTLVTDGSGRKTLNSLSEEMFNSPSFSNLKRLSVRSNRIYSIDINFLRHIPKLEHINLGFNSVIQVLPEDPGKAINMSVELANHMNVSTVDASYFGIVSGEAYSARNLFCWPEPLITDDFFQKPPSYISRPPHLKTGNRTVDYTFADEHEKFLETNVPHSLQYVYGKHIGITRDDFHGFSFNPNNILHIDFSENQLRIISGKFSGFDNLQGLELNSCGLQKIVPEALSQLTNLVSLSLSKNSFTSTNLDFLHNVGNNTMLKFLDLSYNLLTNIKIEDFYNFESIEILNFTNNRICEIFADFSHNPNLKILDLTENSLTHLPEHVTRGLETLHKQSAGAFIVLLSGNPWSCSCEHLDFLQWLRSTKVNIVNKGAFKCLLNNNTIEMMNVDLGELNAVCNPKKLSLAAVVAIPSMLIFASLLATSLSYHYRWTLKWKFYLMRRTFRIMFMKKTSKDEQLLSGSVMSLERTYDAFVSYNHESDYAWVENALLEKVEETWNFKLCIGQRDFMVGVPIAENICEAIDSSRFIIVVITPAFVLSGWCDFELHMALTRGRQHLILVYKEEVDISQTSKTLRTLMKSINYIEYNEDADGQAMFWQRLKDALTMKTEESVSMIS